MATWFELVLSMQICPKNVFDNHFSVHWNYPLTENVFQKRKKNSFLFFAFCKSGGSWKQPHTLIIRITTREFNLTEGRERGPPRGSTTALGKTEHETSLRNPWVTGETGSWKTALVPLQTPKKGCVGRARNADEQSQVQGLISMQAEGGSQRARPASSSCPSIHSESRLPSCSFASWLCSQGSGEWEHFIFPFSDFCWIHSRSI